MDFKVSNFRIRTPGIPVAFVFLESMILYRGKCRRLSSLQQLKITELALVLLAKLVSRSRVGEELYDYFTRDTADELFFPES